MYRYVSRYISRYVYLSTHAHTDKEALEQLKNLEKQYVAETFKVQQVAKKRDFRYRYQICV